MRAFLARVGRRLRFLKPTFDFGLPTWPGQTLAGAIAGLVDVGVSTAGGTTFPNLGVRFAHAFWSIVTCALVGAAFDLACLVTSLIPKERRFLRHVPVILMGAIVLEWIMSRIVVRQADALLDGTASWLLHLLFALGMGVGVSAVIVLGRSLGSARHRFMPLAVLIAGGALTGNHFLLRDDYVEAHTTTVVYATFFFGSFISAKWLSAVKPTGRSLGAFVAVVSIFFVWSPTNEVRHKLFQSPGAAGAWIIANLWWKLPDLAGQPSASVDPRWLGPRDGERRPSEARPMGGPPVVVLLTIDATRRDAVLGEGRPERLKNMGRMIREGTTFTNARSPGSQTAVSMATLFTGKYFSELHWSKYGTGKSRFDYPALDDTPRFVAKLTDAGVSTFKVVSLTFLKNDFGVAAGFAEEEVVTTGRRHARGREVVGPLVERLQAAREDEALFVFAHLTEPHHPYDRAGFKGSPHDRYLAEVNLADEFVGRVMRTLETGNLRNRSILIVSADHGEAFGEHETYQHTKTIYDEMLAIPLLVWGKGVKKQQLDVPVSLVDVGPTILDTFAVPTPDFMAGESLLPLIVTGEGELERPILAEGRLRRAFYLDGVKVLVDERRKTVEAYDLERDPGELVNIFDTEGPRVAPVLAALDLYFAQRSERRDGYEPIYKP